MVVTNAVILDVETNGRDPVEVIELAWYPMTGSEFHFDRVWIHSQFYCPKLPSTFKAKSVHGLIDSDLAGMPPSEVATAPQCEYMIGHNVDYDWKALGSPPCKRICTLALSRLIWPDDEGHSLGAMLYRILGDLEGKAWSDRLHSAIDDVEATHLLLSQIINHFPVDQRSLQFLWQVTEVARVPIVFAFGKFKGMRFRDADSGYFMWYMRQEDTDAGVVTAMERELNIRRGGVLRCPECDGACVVRVDGHFRGLCSICVGSGVVAPQKG